MPKVLDITFREADLERYLGRLVLAQMRLQRQIDVLESRVDELDGPDEYGPEYSNA